MIVQKSKYCAVWWHKSINWTNVEYLEWNTTKSITH